jgi:hypothetical protein
VGILVTLKKQNKNEVCCGVVELCYGVVELCYGVEKYKKKIKMLWCDIKKIKK